LWEGGWYLAQMLYRGAKNVIGFKISKSIIDKAVEALDNFNFSNYDWKDEKNSFWRLYLFNKK